MPDSLNPYKLPMPTKKDWQPFFERSIARATLPHLWMEDYECVLADKLDDC